MMDISPDRIQDQLSRILDSPKFRASKRLSRFLSFVVDQSQKGDSDRIKQYTIAVEVLGYGDDFDPQSDPIVRIQARRLRRALDNYYDTLGASDPIRIDIPKGAYVPIFVKIGSTPFRIKPQAPEKHLLSPQYTVTKPSLMKPASIAVLPFVFQGDNQQEAYLADALTEALTVGLAKFEGLGVIASQSTMQFKGVESSVDEMAKALGVCFLLTGSVRKMDDALRVLAQLTDARDESLLWGESMDRDISSTGIFAALDNISRRIIVNAGDEHGVILHQLIPEILDKPLRDLNIHEASLLYHHYNTTVGIEKHKRIRRVLEHAVDINPEYALGWGQLAAVYGDVYSLDYGGLDNPLERALFCAKKAIALNSRSQESHANLALIRFLLKQHRAAIEEAEKAIPLNPNSAYVVSFCGWIIGLSCDLEQGRRIIDEMDNYKPNSPGWLRLVAFLYHLDKRDYDQALHEARRFRMPDELAWDPICRAVAAGLLGKTKVAAASYNELVNKFPIVAQNVEDTIRLYLHFEHWVEALLKGLEKARLASFEVLEPEIKHNLGSE